MTKDQKPKGFDTDEQHIERGGRQCPQCGSFSIEGASFDHYGSFVTQNVWCNNCDAAWCDTFTLTGYEITRKGR